MLVNCAAAAHWPVDPSRIDHVFFPTAKGGAASSTRSRCDPRDKEPNA
jgi:hypothetical protein